MQAISIAVHRRHNCGLGTGRRWVLVTQGDIRIEIQATPALAALRGKKPDMWAKPQLQWTVQIFKTMLMLGQLQYPEETYVMLQKLPSLYALNSSYSYKPSTAVSRGSVFAPEPRHMEPHSFSPLHFLPHHSFLTILVVLLGYQIAPAAALQPPTLSAGLRGYVKHGSWWPAAEPTPLPTGEGLTPQTVEETGEGLIPQTV
ncbi:hypothetical protein ANN_02985 [Periplaneta americana]|uniref:Uncharacterized protein n=1 Tax=Periplaneta americana TaxID=6978 RepID=A0ABQ8TZF8_PERAM|nr:hypothetical protein ANN_02985 [Periplaneta americana]